MFMSVRGLPPPHAQPYMIFHTYTIIVTSIFINQTKPYRITDKRLFMSDRTSFIEKARELKNSLESLNLSAFDDSPISEEDFYKTSQQLKFAYAECYSLARVPRGDLLHIYDMLRLSLADFFAFDSFRKMRLALLDFVDKFIEYVATLEEFDEILFDAFAGHESSSFWYNADEEICFHIFKCYDDTISMMKIHDGKIEKSSPQEFMTYHRASSIYSISDTLFYYRYNLHGITFKE